MSSADGEVGMMVARIGGVPDGVANGAVDDIGLVDPGDSSYTCKTRASESLNDVTCPGCDEDPDDGFVGEKDRSGSPNKPGGFDDVEIEEGEVVELTKEAEEMNGGGEAAGDGRDKYGASQPEGEKSGCSVGGGEVAGVWGQAAVVVEGSCCEWAMAADSC